MTNEEIVRSVLGNRRAVDYQMGLEIARLVDEKHGARRRRVNMRYARLKMLAFNRIKSAELILSQPDLSVEVREYTEGQLSVWQRIIDIEL